MNKLTTKQIRRLMFAASVGWLGGQYLWNLYGVIMNTLYRLLEDTSDQCVVEWVNYYVLGKKSNNETKSK